MSATLCFVLMPFGDKTDAAGNIIKFDDVYAQVVRPAIEDAGLTPMRADEQLTGGMITRQILERLILSEIAIADLTGANPNVLYELGVRHASRPASTVLLFSREGRLPFDVSGMHAVPYQLGSTGAPSNPASDRAKLAEILRRMREAPEVDSPVFGLLESFPSVLPHLETPAFKNRIEITEQLEQELRGAKTPEELKDFERKLPPLDRVDSAIVIKLFLAYRNTRAWDAMIALAAAMPEPLKKAVMIREQLALALNRAGRGDEAEDVLRALLEERGGSSETYALLGRIYKDRWQRADNRVVAMGQLDRAIDAYVKGFEADWRDAYPGVNAVTLMEIRNPPDPRRIEILPVVRYAVSRRLASGNTDYWDYATLLELAVLARNEADATESLAKALPIVRAKWEPETTLNNLRMISAARRERREDEPSWMDDVMQALESAAL